MLSFFQSSNTKSLKTFFTAFRPSEIGRGAVLFYQATFSYFLGGNCRYYPSCSHYGAEAFSKFGFRKASWLTLNRLLSCHPFSKKAFFDPVPIHTLEMSSK